MFEVPQRHNYGLPAKMGVGLIRQPLECGQELLALAAEQSIGREAGDRSHCARKSIVQRTNDCDLGQAGVDEFARDWKDQAGLNQVGRLQRRVVEKIGKRQAGYGVGKRRYGLLHAVAREINPLEEVSDLVSTNAKGYLKHLWIRYFLAHGCVETGAALLDH